MKQGFSANRYTSCSPGKTYETAKIVSDHGIKIFGTEEHNDPCSNLWCLSTLRNKQQEARVTEFMRFHALGDLFRYSLARLKTLIAESISMSTKTRTLEHSNSTVSVCPESRALPILNFFTASHPPKEVVAIGTQTVLTARQKKSSRLGPQ